MPIVLKASKSSTVSTSTNFSAIGIKFVVVEFFINKFVLVEFSTNFTQYDFFQVPKIVLSGDPLYFILIIIILLKTKD